MNEILRDESKPFELRKRCDWFDRILVWVRSEIAVAKTASIMKEKNLKSGVIVQGQVHRQQFEVLGREIGFTAVIHQTVPWRYRDDEAR